MKSSDPGNGPPKALAQLLRLRNVRVDAAQAEVQRQRAECARAADAVQQRLQHIAENRQHVDRHAAYTVGDGVQDLPRLAPLFSAFREKLGDTLERNEYALVDDEETLEAEQARLRDRQQAWRREQSRRDGIGEALQRSRRTLAQHADQQADNDADECTPNGTLARLAARNDTPHRR